jgi:hypothetical protein
MKLCARPWKGPQRIRPLSVYLTHIHRTESRTKPFWTDKEWVQAADPSRLSLKIGVEDAKHPL